MIRIQKIKNLLGILCMALLSVSCEKWLDVSPETEVKYDDLFSYKNGFKDQLTGIYTNLCSEDLYGAHLSFGMMDALGQQYTWQQAMGKYYHLHRFEYEEGTSEGVIAGVWNKMYNTIANVNILLQGIEEHRSVLTEEEEKIYEGEAYALRAFMHFDLLRLFGKSFVSGAQEKSIPYVRKISKEVTPLSTVSEVIELALQDLEKAASLLEQDPEKTGSATTAFIGTREFHLNYYAVRALMARICMYKNDKVNALKYAQEVIESKKYPWVSSGSVTTSDRNSRDGIFMSECIWMLNNSKLGSLVDVYLKESEDNEGNLLVTSAEVRNEIFESNLYGGSEPYNTNFISSKLWQVSSTYNKKQPLLRISEMFLIAAECADNTKDALAYINELRRHRGFQEGDDIWDEGMTAEKLQTIIGKEYRKEFIGEGQWFFYCKRTDQPILPSVTVTFSKGFYVLPMPDQEVDYGNRN